MGTWGTKISENDGTSDVLLEWGSKYFKKHKDADGYVDLKKSKVTKTEFGKAFQKMLKDAKLPIKELKKPYLLGSPFITSVQHKSKYEGFWNVNLVLAIYILGRNCGYVFNKDFLGLVDVAGYQYAATSGLFTNDKSRKSVISIGTLISKSTGKKGKINLMKHF